MRCLAFIEDPQLIQKILEHLGLWLVKRKPAPRAHGPPMVRWNFTQIIPAGPESPLGRRRIRRSHPVRTICTKTELDSAEFILRPSKDSAIVLTSLGRPASGSQCSGILEYWNNGMLVLRPEAI